MYTELETMLDRLADTAAGADLDKKAAERSLIRAPASPPCGRPLHRRGRGGLRTCP